MVKAKKVVKKAKVKTKASAPLKAKKKFKGAKAAPVSKKSKWRSLVLLGSPSVRQTLIDLAGENTLNVIKEFDKEMSDEELARKTKIKVSEVRAVLNKMHSGGLVSYTRNRDKDSGWYSYLWKLNTTKMEEILPKAEQERNAESGEEATEGEHYICRICNPDKKVPFDRASELLFKCEVCGSSLEFFENQKRKQ